MSNANFSFILLLLLLLLLLGNLIFVLLLKDRAVIQIF